MNIQINNPCRENWDAMSVTEGGRFCGSCKCKVHDFTQASAEEINKKYAENNGKLCVRIYKNPVAEEFKNAAIRKGYFHNLKIFCWAALLSFGASLFSIPAAAAKTMIGLRSEILNDEKKSGNKTASEITIKGTVKDKESKEELIGAIVVAVADDSVIAGCSADINGQYELKIDTANYKKIDLKITYISYEDNIVKDVALTGNLVLDLEMQASMLLGNVPGPKPERLEVIMGISIQRIEPLVPMSEPLIKTKRYKRTKVAERNK